MSTPSDPQRGGQQPDQQYGQQPAPYGQPPSPYGQPGAYGGQPYPGPAYGGQPYAGDQGAYAYSPYGTPYGSPYGAPYPAGLDDRGVETAARPGIMALSLLLLILSALPFLAVGAILLLAFTAESIPPEVLNDPRLVDAGATPDLLISLLRALGGILAALALLYIVFAVLAFRGRNWARIIVAVMTVGFTLLLLAGAVGGAASDGGSLLFLLLIMVASVAGTVILFLPASARFFANPR